MSLWNDVSFIYGTILFLKIFSHFLLHSSIIAYCLCTYKRERTLSAHPSTSDMVSISDEKQNCVWFWVLIRTYRYQSFIRLIVISLLRKLWIRFSNSVSENHMKDFQISWRSIWIRFSSTTNKKYRKKAIRKTFTPLSFVYFVESRTFFI
jgi:hypothetical protein